MLSFKMSIEVLSVSEFNLFDWYRTKHLLFELRIEKENPSRQSWMDSLYLDVLSFSNVESTNNNSSIILFEDYSQFPAPLLASSREPTFSPGYLLIRIRFPFSSFNSSKYSSRISAKIAMFETLASKT